MSPKYMHVIYLELGKCVRLPVLALLHCFVFFPGYFHHLPICVHISNDCNFVIFLVISVHVSHPCRMVDQTLYNYCSCFYASCIAVIVFNTALNASSNLNYVQDLIDTSSIRCYSLSQIGIFVSLFYYNHHPNSK